MWPTLVYPQPTSCRENAAGVIVATSQTEWSNYPSDETTKTYPDPSVWGAETSARTTCSMEQPNPLAKLREPLVTRADSDKSIEAFERKRQEKAERQKNEIIDAATAYRKFEPISLVSLSDNAKMLSLSLLFIVCHLLTGVLYFHHVVGWPIDGKSLSRRRPSRPQPPRSLRLSCHLPSHPRRQTRCTSASCPSPRWASATSCPRPTVTSSSPVYTCSLACGCLAYTIFNLDAAPKPAPAPSPEPSPDPNRFSATPSE